MKGVPKQQKHINLSRPSKLKQSRPTQLVLEADQNSGRVEVDQIEGLPTQEVGPREEVINAIVAARTGHQPTIARQREQSVDSATEKVILPACAGMPNHQSGQLKRRISTNNSKININNNNKYPPPISRAPLKQAQ